mgnify:CR=1 FL=1
MANLIACNLNSYRQYRDTGYAHLARIETGAAKEVGQLETLNYGVESSDSPRKLYFAMKVLDNVGNGSEMGSVEVNVPAKPGQEG